MSLHYTAIRWLVKLLVCLRFLATGSLHLVMADTVHISRQTVAGRCIRTSMLDIFDSRAKARRHSKDQVLFRQDCW